MAAVTPERRDRVRAAYLRLQASRVALVDEVMRAAETGHPPPRLARRLGVRLLRLEQAMRAAAALLPPPPDPEVG